KNVKDNLTTITGKVRGAQSDARFAVASYGDEHDPDGRAFRVLQPLTNSQDLVAGAVRHLDAHFGGDTSEDWINALFQVAHGGAGTFRPGASPIVVRVGDASSHDPSMGHSLQSAIDALVAAHVKVLAVSIDTGADGLDGNGFADTYPRHDGGEATKVVTATRGTLLKGINPDEVAATAAPGLARPPATVSH